MAFDAAADRRAVLEVFRADLELVERHGGKGDIYLVFAILLAVPVAGILIGDLTIAALVGVLPAAALIGWLWYNRGWRAAKAKRRVTDGWLAHFASFNPHSVSGEAVRVRWSDVTGGSLTIEFDDGCTTSLHCSQLHDAEGIPYPQDPLVDYFKRKAETTRRLAKARWATDDGRIGFVRDYRHGPASEYGSEPDSLLLKFENGHEWVSLRELTPVP
jgi:hypothetical protein